MSESRALRRRSAHRISHVAGLAAATLALLGGATLAAAPTASASSAAVGRSACNIKDALPGSVWKTLNWNVNLRSGPGTKYFSYGQLRKGTTFTYHCTYETRDKKTLWYYGTVRQGAHKGQSGWINWAYAGLA
ncbi:SH3 domain-containing protein [Streptomyces sp. NPDC001709]